MSDFDDVVDAVRELAEHHSPDAVWDALGLVSLNGARDPKNANACGWYRVWVKHVYGDLSRTFHAALVEAKEHLAEAPNPFTKNGKSNLEDLVISQKDYDHYIDASWKAGYDKALYDLSDVLKAKAQEGPSGLQLSTGLQLNAEPDEEPDYIGQCEYTAAAGE